jgi:hypothetical protein
MHFHLKRRLAVALSAALLATGVMALVASPAVASAGTIGTIAAGEQGNGPCGADGIDEGYYATGTGQSSSCDGSGGEAHAWCADFAAWVWQQAGATVDGNLTNGAGSFVAYGTAHGTVHSSASYQPQVGDAVVFDYETDGNGPGAADHVALVSSISYNPDGSIASLTYMNGNWGGQVGPQVETGNFLVGQDPPNEIGENGQMTISYYVSPSGLTTTAPPTTPALAFTYMATMTDNQDNLYGYQYGRLNRPTTLGADGYASPAIVGLSDDSTYLTAFQDNDNQLYLHTSTAANFSTGSNSNTKLGMVGNTNPSIAALSTNNQWEVAYQGTNEDLYLLLR